MTQPNSDPKAAERTEQLPELITGKQAMDLLGIRHRLTFSRFVAKHPHVTCRIGGMHRPKYRRRELQSILRSTSS